MNKLTLLPLDPDSLEFGKKQVFDTWNHVYSKEEFELLIEHQFDKWLLGHEPAIPDLVGDIIQHATWFGSLESPRDSTPAKLYQRLVNEVEISQKVERIDAVVVLSYLPQIIKLVEEFKLSAAGVAQVLNRSDKRILLHWKVIEKILVVLKMNQVLDLEEVESLIENDRAYMERFLCDANLQALIENLKDQSSSYRLGDIFSDALEQMLNPKLEARHTPYLQIIYYLCALTHFYDHPLEFLYTFKPRGRVAERIFEVFPSEMASTGNPILNNFKALDRLSIDWARSRDDYPTQARALVEIILGMSSLSYSSRRYLSQFVRSSLLRVIEIECPDEYVIENYSKLEEVQLTLFKVASSETNTRGIIEQRIADFLGALLYSEPRWKSRGLGDSVNAANSAKKKLGDVDFQSVDDRRCCAIEAHAGVLTDVYVNEHLRTLRANLPSRVEEWSNLSHVSDWRLELLFIVHQNNVSDLPQLKGSVEVAPEILTYQEFIGRSIAETKFDKCGIINLFNELVVLELNKSNVPHYVKKVFGNLK